MPLVVNGVTIPTDVANALNVNGSNITAVYANGISVWEQQLFAAQWSGDSLAVSGSYVAGVSVSGNLFRHRYSSIYGAWITTNSNGTFTSTSSNASGNKILGFGDNRLQARNNGCPCYCGYDGFIYFSIAGGFSGTSKSHSGDCDGGDEFNNFIMQTSTGLIRAGYGFRRSIVNSYSAYGAWISLT